jgi:hypothetical protein
MRYGASGVNKTVLLDYVTGQYNTDGTLGN